MKVETVNNTHITQKNRDTHLHTHTHRGGTERGTDRRTDTDRHRQTQTDTDRHRQTQTDTDRHTKPIRAFLNFTNYLLRLGSKEQKASITMYYLTIFPQNIN